MKYSLLNTGNMEVNLKMCFFSVLTRKVEHKRVFNKSEYHFLFYWINLNENIPSQVGHSASYDHFKGKKKFLWKGFATLLILFL